MIFKRVTVKHLSTKKPFLLIASFTLIYTFAIILIDFDSFSNLRYALLNKEFISLNLLLLTINLKSMHSRWIYLLNKVNFAVKDFPKNQIFFKSIILISLPARAGDFYRGVIMGKYEGKGFSKGSAITISERVIDLISILSLLFWGLNQKYIACFLLICSIYILNNLTVFRLESLPWITNSIVITKRYNFLSNLLRVSECRPYLIKLLKFQPFMISLIFSNVCWITEAFSIYLFLGITGLNIPFTDVIALRAVMALGALLTFLPGGIGGIELTVIGFANIINIPIKETLCAALVLRLWYVFIPALFCILLSKVKRVD